MNWSSWEQNDRGQWCLFCATINFKEGYENAEHLLTFCVSKLNVYLGIYGNLFSCMVTVARLQVGSYQKSAECIEAELTSQLVPDWNNGLIFYYR